MSHRCLALPVSVETHEQFGRRRRIQHNVIVAQERGTKCAHSHEVQMLLQADPINGQPLDFVPEFLGHAIRTGH